MSNGTSAATVATSLSQIFANLNPQQLNRLGHHLSQSDSMRALQIIYTMKANPALAPTMLPSLSMIPNLPQQVMTWVTNALSNPANFQEDMTQAETAVQAAATNTGILGGLGL
jgi:hypothetical protein